MAEEVEYRDIPGFPGYRVGSDGSVWSCRVHGGIRPPWRLLCPGNRKGDVSYLVVNLWRQGKGYMRYVHRLVLTAFRGPGQPGAVACHVDGNSLNNRVDNLRWGSRKENEADKDRHGRRRRGEKHQNAKLTLNNVRDIRRLRGEGIPASAVAKRFGVSRRHIGKILQGATWKDQH